MKNMKPELSRQLTMLGALLLSSAIGYAQTTTPAAPPAATEEDKEVTVLSPFEVSASENEGYAAENTLAGNRLNMELRDVGNAIQVVTSQFLKDTGAINNETLLQYTTATEVGNIQGNFAGLGDGAQLNEGANFRNANQNTRIRGLTAADTTRDYFLTDIPWDGYNVDRVDLSRGPNSILFGQGSPAGIINASTKGASFRNSAEVEFRVDNEGSTRASLDINRVILKNELAFRVTLLEDREKFKQKPAFEDDSRQYGALRWEPGFLKRGSARTILKVNFENGNISSNRPRSLPPGDGITPWFETGTYQGRYLSSGTDINGNPVTAGDPRSYNALNKLTTNPHTVQNDNFYRTEFPHGLTRPTINGGPLAGRVNPYYNPMVGNFGNAIGGPVGYYDNGSVNANSWVNEEISEVWGINSLGALDRGLGYDFNRLAGIQQYSSFAQNAGLPLAEFGVYKNKLLTDASVFDFYNNLIDGPTKNEWQDFDSYTISLSQTFMNDKFGFDATYYKEDYRNGQLSFLTDWRVGIFVDINRIHTDGTTAGLNGIPYEDGTPNANLGRPFIQDNSTGGNNSYRSQRTSKRLTGFFTHDFSRSQKKNFLNNLLGKHTITGLYAEDEQDTDRRNWVRHAITDGAYRSFYNSTGDWNEGQTFIPAQVIYLGPTLKNASSASGANIPGISTAFDVPASANSRVFDSHWANLPGVDPAALWQNTFYPSTQTAQYNSTQSENPANYVGWRNNLPLIITDSEDSAANRNMLTTSASLQRKRTTSKVFVWQGNMLNGALVGTYGYRNDRAQAWSRNINTNSKDPNAHEDGIAGASSIGYLNWNAYYLPKIGSDLSEISRSYSIVAHLDKLPGLGKFLEKSPVSISLLYSTSENFQPEALRRNMYGEQLPLPKGTTIDRGLLLETRDGKYSLRVNKFVTEATNATSSALGRGGFLGTAIARGTNWANQFEYDLGINNQPSGHIISSQVNNRPSGAAQPPGVTAQVRPGNPEWDPTNTLYNYGTDVGEDQAAASAREASAVAAWRAFQSTIDSRFWTAWGMDPTSPFRATNPIGLNSSTPNGFAITEDSVSQGYEIEFSAQPTKNWRVAFNAAKIEAQRKNIGGTELASFIDAYETALAGGAKGSAGDIRIWWGGSGNDTTFRQWYGGEGLGGEWASRKLQEGTNVPEMREWRFNAITNYDFTEGRLKGLSVGGGIRYQSEVIIGYPPILAAGNKLSYELANPYMGPAETNFDFWIGYGRKLRSKIDWRIQLNVRNAFQGNDLIPITTQPDGSPAAYRIAPAQTITLTNTFKF